MKIGIKKFHKKVAYWVQNKNYEIWIWEIVWEYTAENFYATFMSNARKLPNWNIFGCDGIEKKVYEISPKWDVLYEYKLPWDGHIFKVFVYPKDYKGLEKLIIK